MKTRRLALDERVYVVDVEQGVSLLKRNVLTWATWEEEVWGHDHVLIVLR